MHCSEARPTILVANPLRSEIRALRRRVEELEELCGLAEARKIQLPVRHRAERIAIILVLLQKRELVSRITILLAQGKDGTARTKSVDVDVCRARKVLKEWGIPLETDWGRGWYVEPKYKAALRMHLDRCKPSSAEDATVTPRAAA